MVERTIYLNYSIFTMKEVIKFEEKLPWVLAGKQISISKIKTVTYDMLKELRKTRVRFDEIDPKTALMNVIKNVGLLQTGTFLEKNKDTVIARINDVSGETMIRTNWEIPIQVFNSLVTEIQIKEYLPEHLFYVTSKIA